MRVWDSARRRNDKSERFSMFLGTVMRNLLTLGPWSLYKQGNGRNLWVRCFGNTFRCTRVEISLAEIDTYEDITYSLLCSSFCPRPSFRASTQPTLCHADKSFPFPQGSPYPQSTYLFFLTSYFTRSYKHLLRNLFCFSRSLKM